MNHPYGSSSSSGGSGADGRGFEQYPPQSHVHPTGLPDNDGRQQFVAFGFQGPPAPMMMFGGPPPMAMRPMLHSALPFGAPHGPPMAMNPAFHAPMHIVPPQMQLPVRMGAVAQQQPQQQPMAAGWSEHFTPQGGQYFYNAATGASTYEQPAAATVAVTPLADASVVAAGADSDGRWLEYKDQASGKFYYYHTVTKETVWDQPEAFRMQQARDEVDRMVASAAARSPTDDSSATTTTATEEAATAASELSVTETKTTTTTSKKQQLLQQESEDRARFEQMPREARVAEFKAFLEQHAVPPQLKWPDVQRLVAKEGYDKDPRWRFAALSAGDKKQSFAEYCTHAVNRQHIEKRRQVKKNREDFLALLADFQALLAPSGSRNSSSSSGGRRSGDAGGGGGATATAPIDLEDVNTGPQFYALRQDPRWLVLEDQKEKRSLLNGFLQDIARKQAQAVAKQRDTVRRRFVEHVRQKAETGGLLASFLSSSSSSSHGSSSRHHHHHHQQQPLLDAELKAQLWRWLWELEASLGAKNAAGLRTVQKQDVYAWGEDVLVALRDEAHARRKQARELWREREPQLLAALEAALRASPALTAASSWEQTRVWLAEAEQSAVADADATAAERGASGETRTLSERARVRVFERVVRERRAALQPSVAAVTGHLSHGSGFEVTATSSFEGFVAALTAGIRSSVDAKRPEDGEEAAVNDDQLHATEGTADGVDAEMRTKQHELEALVIAHSSSSDSDSVLSIVPEYPAYVSEVFALLVALATEKKRATKTKSKSKTADASSRSRKRRRSDGSCTSPLSGRSASRSRSRSRTRAGAGAAPTATAPAKTRSRSPSPVRSRKRRSQKQQQTQPSKPKANIKPAAAATAGAIDRSAVWKTNGSAFAFDPINGDADMRLPSAAAAAQESARAEEIIRQARLKLQREAAQSGELEEGEEVEGNDELKQTDENDGGADSGAEVEQGRHAAE